jgi:L-serine deaminase
MAEVGVASSMAAGALAACMGGGWRACIIRHRVADPHTTPPTGTTKQILEAAEIAMEQSLGLTCDPVDGLVVSML